MAEPFNPLDKANLGKSVVEALLNSAPSALEDIDPFLGAGIYAIYYHGDFQAYRQLSARFASPGETPIYVGKAVPSGSRKGASLTVSASGRWLYNRICEHRESIRAATNIEAPDFSVRSLAVDDIWIPLSESLMISTFSPVWNVLIDGFGNHDPGAGRYSGLQPLWDVLHPGRAWAAKCRQRTENPAELCNRINDFLVSRFGS